MGNIEENQQQTVNEKINKRPDFLTVLCILTFVGSGFSLLGQMSTYFMYDMLPQLMESIADTIGGEVGEIYRSNPLADIPRYYFLVASLIYVLAIVGASFMLLLKKIGFHLYIISQLLLVAAPLLIGNPIHLGTLFLSLAFILLYARFIKIMK